MTIANFPISAGDTICVDINETPPAGSGPSRCRTSRGQTFKQTAPYASTYASAEWIEETPLLIGTNAGLASLPNLTRPRSPTQRSTANANLKASEAIDLTDSNGSVIGAPSAPNGTADGFSLCAHATSC